MKKDSLFSQTIKSAIENKEMLQVYFDHADGYNVFLPIGYNDRMVMWADIESSGSFGGIKFCPWDDVNLLVKDSEYLKVLEQKIDQNSLQQKIEEIKKYVQKLGWQGVLTGLKNTDKMVTIGFFDDREVEGKVTAVDNEGAMLDEYKSGKHGKFATALFELEKIKYIWVSSPWLESLESFAKEK